MSLLNVRHLAEYLFVRLSIALIQAVSIETCQTVSRVVAWLAHDVLRIRREITLDNLRHTFPEKSEAERERIARHMWQHLVLFVCEIAHASRKIHETNWRDYVSCRRKRDMVRIFLSPRPSVIVTAHFGNFEVGGFITGFWGFKTYTVARPLDNPYLDRLVNKFRESMGQVMLASRDTAEIADDFLAEGGKLVLVGDQHAGSRGVWVEFMGRHASCHKALGLFSLLNKAPMGVICVKRTKGPMHFEAGLTDLFDPLEPGHDELHDVTELTQWYNDAMEREIRRAPEQYWWLHRRWRDAPPAKRRRKRKTRSTAPAVPLADEQRPAA